jgi:RNA polymerase sigma-70 factor, ECF subfamily
MEPKQESEIILRILGGERDAYALLVDSYKGPVFNLAYRMTGSYEDARDLAQEAFLRAYRNLRHFDREKRFFTWIYTIGLNLIRRHLKQCGRNTYQETAERSFPPAGIQGGERVEQDMIRSQEISRLEICLLKLPAELREAVVLRFYQDLPFEEIARVADASVSAVKMRVYRGLEKLRRLMEEG